MKNGKTLFVYNPKSGRGQIVKHLDYIVKNLKRRFTDIDIVESKSEEFFLKTIHEGCYNYEYILFSGGDGTFNMVVNCIPDIDDLPVFGYLPGGSTCDMSYNVNVSKNPRKGVIDLIHATIKDYNVGFFGDRKFIYVCDFGVFTDLVHKTPSDKKKKFGMLAYGIYGAKYFFRSKKSYRITVDGVEYITPMAVFSNSREVGASRINPEKEQNDGNYYCVIVKDGPMYGLFNLAYFYAFGIEEALKNGKIVSYSSSMFVVDCEMKEWDIDGETSIINFPSAVGYSGKTIRVLVNR